MSTQRKTGLAIDLVAEDAVVEFLRENPDFFQRHPLLLGTLNLPHRSGAGTVSLVERQVEVLRERNRNMERKLRELVGTARANDKLAGKIHGLALRLMAARDFPTVLATVDKVLREDFGADEFTVVLFDADPSTALEVANYVRCRDRNDPGLQAFRSFLSGASPRCGRIQTAQRDYLFRSGAQPVASAALAPLGVKSAQGFLAVGSYDSRHFHPGMSTDFLARVGDLVAHAMAATSV